MIPTNDNALSLSENIDLTDEQIASRITHAQFFDKMMPELSRSNWKVKSMINSMGGYDNLPTNIKKLIDKKLNVRRVTIIIPIDDTDRK